MRITNSMLHKFAQDTVNSRLRNEPDLHAAYLTGSLLSESPLLGGSTDIDLVLVHKYQAPVDREVQPLTPEVSLDIYHKTKNEYDEHRQFRKDPWRGYPLTHNHILLFDTDHWLEFIQASVSAHFHHSENVLARVQKLSTAARDQWFSLLRNPAQSYQEWLNRYLQILSLAANSIAELIGPPLTRRRFLVTFKNYAEALGVPKIVIGLYGLLGLSDERQDALDVWIDAFQQDFDHLQKESTPPVHLSPCRRDYYLNAIRALATSDDPLLAGWPLLHTWLDVRMAAIKDLPGEEAWQNCLETLELTEESAEQKIEALDVYLDSLDIVIENWSSAYRV